MARSTIYTVGHSNRSADQLAALLEEFGIELLVDVRRYPGSRRLPHFNRAALETLLEPRGIRYRHAPHLGGHRDPAQDSPNTAWKEPALRAYADHMDGRPFTSAMKWLMKDALGTRCAVMCAEASPRRCHRQLLADRLLVAGTRVVHILGPRESELHRLHPDARETAEGGLVYPAQGGEQLDLFGG